MTTIDSTPEKIIYTQRELLEAPLALAIYYKEKKEEGVFFSSKSQSDSSPFFEISHPKGLEYSGILADDDVADESVAVGVIAGVGNRFELELLANKYRTFLFAEIAGIGMYQSISREIRLAFAGMINKEFRSRDSDVPCRVEMIIVTRFFEELEIVRIKGDGDFHMSSPRFGVVGGYRKIRGKKISVRGMALKMLNLFYEENGRPPTLKEANDIANLALSQDKRKMPHTFVQTFSF